MRLVPVANLGIPSNLRKRIEHDELLGINLVDFVDGFFANYAVWRPTGNKLCNGFGWFACIDIEIENTGRNFLVSNQIAFDIIPEMRFIEIFY